MTMLNVGHAVVHTVSGVRDDGGATVSVIAGALVPTRGYVVAVAGHEHRTPWPRDLRSQAARVQAYVHDHRAALAQAGHYLGAWRDGADVVLDVVEILPERAAAIAAGIARGEDAIYDLARGEDIRL